MNYPDDWTWEGTEARRATRDLCVMVDADNDVCVDFIAEYEGDIGVCIPVEIMAEVLRRAGYTVTKP